jgi:hypothetical protein
VFVVEVYKKRGGNMMSLLNVADFGKNAREFVSNYSKAANNIASGGVMKGILGSKVGSGVGINLKGPFGMGIEFKVGSLLDSNADSKLDGEAEAGSDVANDAVVDDEELNEVSDVTGDIENVLDKDTV